MTNHWPFGSLWRFTPGGGRRKGGHEGKGGDTALTFWWIRNFSGFFPCFSPSLPPSPVVSEVDEVVIIIPKLR